METIGILLIFISGLAAGFRGWPLPLFKKYKLEHWLMIYIVLGVMVFPWLTIWIFCPNLGEIIKALDIKNLILANVFSVSWAFANIIYSYCFVKIGFTVASSVLGGTAIIFGTIVPMIIKGSGNFSKSADPFSSAGLFSIGATIILTISVVLASLAGQEREKQKGTFITVDKDGSYYLYVALCILSGILCLGIVFISAYCQSQIVDTMKAYNTPESLSYIGVWAFTMLGTGITTFIQTLIYIIKDKNLHLFKDGKEFLMSFSAGILFFIYLLFLSIGAVMAGPLGACIAGGVGQAATTGGTQLLGVMCGEWKGIKGKPILLIVASVTLLLIGIATLSFAKNLL